MVANLLWFVSDLKGGSVTDDGTEHDPEGDRRREGPDEHRHSQGLVQHGAGAGGGDRQGHQPRRRASRRQVLEGDPPPDVVLARIRRRVRCRGFQAAGQDQGLDRGLKNPHPRPPVVGRRRPRVPPGDHVRHPQGDEVAQHVGFPRRGPLEFVG